MKNPLYAATEYVEEELDRCPDSLTNITQIKPLVDFSETPFCSLEVIPRNEIVASPKKLKKVTIPIEVSVVTPTRDSKWFGVLRDRRTLKSSAMDLFSEETSLKKKRSFIEEVKITGKKGKMH